MSGDSVMSDIGQRLWPLESTLCHMVNSFDGIIERFLLAGTEFERRLRAVRSEQWDWPTPCTEWTVRLLVNHVTRGNLNYVRLLQGGTSAEFLRLRDVDALGTDPVGAYTRSVRECAGAFSRPGALQQVLDYPLGRVSGRQALAVRTTDSIVHTWDLAQALGVDDNLDTSLVIWIDDHLDAIYAGLAETPTAVETTHRFFAAPEGVAAAGASRQERVLRRMGRDPGRGTATWRSLRGSGLEGAPDAGREDVGGLVQVDGGVARQPAAGGLGDGADEEHLHRRG